MNYSKVGLYVGTVVGLIIFVAVWLLPVAFIGGVSGSKIQGFVSGNSQGFISVAIMVFIVIVTGVLFTAFLSFAGWVTGNVYGVLKSKTIKNAEKQVETQWYPEPWVTGNAYGALKSKTSENAEKQVVTQWCPQI